MSYYKKAFLLLRACDAYMCMLTYIKCKHTHTHTHKHTHTHTHTHTSYMQKFNRCMCRCVPMARCAIYTHRYVHTLYMYIYTVTRSQVSRLTSIKVMQILSPPLTLYSAHQRRTLKHIHTLNLFSKSMPST